MKKPEFIFLYSLLMGGCIHIHSESAETETSSLHGYFADASECNRTSVRSEKLLLPSPTAGGAIDIPLGTDAGEFMLCMGRAGRPVAPADLNEYLLVSTQCLQEAGSAADADVAYGDCIARSKLKVEILPNR